MSTLTSYHLGDRMVERITKAGDERRDCHECLSFSGLCDQTVGRHRMLGPKLAGRSNPFERPFAGFAPRLGHQETGQLDGVLFASVPMSTQQGPTAYSGEGGQLIESVGGSPAGPRFAAL
jgi:hypothetical protein